MKFKDFLIDEMPHVEYDDNKVLDFHREDDLKKWLFDVARLFRIHKDKKKKEVISKHLLNDNSFKLAFSKDWKEQLTSKDRTLIKKDLPLSFSKSMGI